MTEKAIISCPYCGVRSEVKPPNGAAKLFAHPTDGKRRIRLGQLDHEWGTRIFNDFWSPKILKGTKEISIRCKRCKFEFHTLFFVQEDLDIHRYYDLEFHGVSSKPIIARLIDLIHLPPVISCIFVAILLWLIWAIPIISFGGLNKICSDLMSFLSIFALSILLFAIRYHIEVIENMKEPIKHILKIKQQKMKGWIYERFKCYILGRGNPRKMLLPDLVGLICLLTYLLYYFAKVFFISPQLTLFESFIAGGQIKYTSYAAAISGSIFWGFTAFAYGTAFWLAISTTWSIYKMGAWLPLNINTLEKTGGTKPLGYFALSAIIPLIAAEFTIILPILATAGVEIYLTPYLALVTTLTVVIFALFFSSLYSIHLGLKRKKEDSLKRIRQKYYVKQKQLMRIISAKNESDSKDKFLLTRARLLRAFLSNLEFFEKRVESMRTWPYDFAIIWKLIGSALLPFLTILLKELIWKLLNF